MIDPDYLKKVAQDQPNRPKLELVAAADEIIELRSKLGEREKELVVLKEQFTGIQEIASEYSSRLDSAIQALREVREWALTYRHPDGMSFEEDKELPFLTAHNGICAARGHTPVVHYDPIENKITLVEKRNTECVHEWGIGPNERCVKCLAWKQTVERRPPETTATRDYADFRDEGE